ncbi:superoxide dismutase [Candidatus Peregrinibacteria bacterium]|jgi:superoxide dismutase, Fe-Mn family|nr:superoxide dismutase [Candidatus Peregrinibacteria bacterium]MBT3599187.1 superoxide dismutase [Candidatus Peregrinibacteria bacterium]MBT4585641.1 superoxide dismutase [Candidatus Peregrinibacteria bacterium]MBT6730901.1 superoxide dismutase [Candidatus Peregrinibacteria bacterium]MBT7345166.1 superoxide dismutase [Candidatus Peregrinibacteria bacterium]
MAYTLPDLSYSYDALEPHIDAKTMETHHSKHHNSYVQKANAAVAGTKWEGLSIKELLVSPSEIPDDIRTAAINNGGGHANHSLFWEMLSPTGGGEPSGALREAIDSKFGSFEEFKNEFSNAAKTQFGSGWAWLVVSSDNELEVMKTSNQETPLSIGKKPILTLDVWEHAYYLKYQNRRPDYVEAFWNIVDWGKVEELFRI